MKNARPRKKFGRSLRPRGTGAPGDAVTRRASARAVEALETRVMLAAHVVGDPTVYSTIQGAVNAASAGAVINVDAGTYVEAVTVNKTLTINGAQSGLDARANLRQSGAGESVVNVTGSAPYGFNITADGVTIDGFTVQGNSGIPVSEVGILISPNRAGTTVVNNIVRNNVAGMYLASSSATNGTLIQHNVFSLNNQPGTNGGRGIYTDGGVAGSALQNVLIDGNFFYQNLGGIGTTGLEAAISLEAVAITPTDIEITNNTFEGNGKALLAYHATNLTITGNTITDTQDVDSGALRFEGGVTNVTIQNNNLYYNLSPAIRMDSKAFGADNSGFTVTNNNIYGNGYVDLASPPPGNIPGAMIVAAGTYTGALSAINNWWGSASGPGGDGPGTGDVLRTGANNVTFSPFATSAAVAQSSPYDGLVSTPDSPVQAANYDHGGSGVGFLVGSGTVNSGGNYRDTAVPTQSTSDPGGSYAPGVNVTSLTAGQWLAYTLNVATAGTYRIDLRVANSQTTGGVLHATVDGASVGGSISVPNTGGAQAWQTIPSANFVVSAGQHVLKLNFDTNGSGGTIGNIHWLQLTTVSGASSPPTAPTGLTATLPAPGQINLAWTNTANNQTGFEIDRSTDGTTFTVLANVAANVATYADMGLAPGTTYYYHVEAVNAAGPSPSSNTVSAVTQPFAPTTFVSDLNWVNGTTGFGTIHKDATVNGNTIKIRGTSYAKGIGTHAVSQIDYNLGGQYSRFQSDIGVDDEVLPNSTSLIFKVVGDGVTLFTSATLTQTSAVVHVDVSVVGVQQLSLIVNNGVASIDNAHADWAGAKLLSLPTAPTGLTATAAASGTQIDLAWTGTAPAKTTGFEIDRSTDGVNFALLTNVAANVTTYSNTGLTPGTSYWYRVEATNSAGLSPASNVANAVTVKATPVYTGLSAPTITYSAASTALSGTIASGTLIPTGNVSITVNGVTTPAAINQTTGAFSINLDTHALPASGSPYTITYAYAGDSKFNALSNTAQTLTVNKRLLTVTATAANKVYDGLTTATPTLGDNRAAGDVLTATFTTATFADKNVANGKTVTVNGIAITGAAAGNYTLAATTATATANITAKSLTVTAAGANKVYDGTTAATITPGDNRVAGDVLTITYTAAFANKTVGNAKAVSVTGIALTGADAANYALSATTAATTANITARSLTVTATGVSKTYDGTTASTVTLGDNRVAGDALTVSSTSATFADKNVGTGKTVSVSGIAVTGADVGNYTLANTTASTTADVTARSLTVTAAGVNKVYDGTTATTVTLADNRVAGDVLTPAYTAAAFATKGVGVGKTVNVTGITLGGADAGNYTANASTTATANITAKSLTVTVTGVNKVYDGTTVATVTPADNRVAGDVFTETYTAAFADKNVGNGKPVGVTGIALTGADAGNYTLANTTANTTANITARVLTFTATGVNKAYDGTTAATVTLSDDRAAGDVFTDNYFSAAFANKNAGTGKAITVSGLTIIGADAGNYLFGGSTTATANITPRALNVTATGTDKVYDATTAATVTLADNRVAGDVLTPAYTAANFADKNVGAGKTVGVTGISLTGADAANYTPNTTTSATAGITPKSLTVTATGVNRAYDGTTAATVNLGDNRVAGDVLTDGYLTATFADKNVGNAKPVGVTGISISGADAGNYSLGNTTAGTTANVTQRALVVSATGVDKVYDRTTAVSVTLSDNRVSGDVLTATYTTAAFADKNAGNAKPVSVTGIGVTGADAANYTFNATASATANITPKALLVSATGVNKVYDGTTAATVTLADNRIAGDVVTDAYGTANFADKNVGTVKTVNVTGINVTGADAANYAANATASTTANVTARSLTVTATGIDRVYDGTTTATVNLADNRVAGDVVNDAYAAAAFANKNVGSSKAVSVTGISIGGADASNYALANTTASAAANVTRRALTVGATGVNKVYDATTAATVNLTDDRVAGDALTATYTTAAFADKNVGTAKPVAVSGVNVTGTDAANYTFNTTASTTANVSARSITVTATGVNKVYDGTTAATVTLADNRVAGDVVTDAYAAANFTGKNVGTGKTVNVTGITIGGADGANYALANATASATASISVRIMTVTATGVNKVYDGTTAATVTLADDRAAGDTLTTSYATAAYGDKNVGAGKAVSVGGITAVGADAANYVLNTSASTTADITPLALTGSVTVAAKVYDATTAATINTRSLAGVRGTDAVSLVGGSAAFGTAAVGSGKTVTVTGLSISGADVGNYTLGNPTETATADVTPLGISGSVTASDKVYDGTTAASLLTRSLTGLLGTDSVTLTGGTATFDTRNAGTGKVVSATGFTLAGPDAGNYSLANATITTNAAVTARTIGATATVANKPYDGNTVASILTRTPVGAVAGDAVSVVGGTATFDTKNVGVAKAVAVAGLGLSGADAGNYLLSPATASATADITPRLVLNGTGAADNITLVVDADLQHVDWFLNGTSAVGQLSPGDLTGLTVNANGANDVVTLDYTNGNPLPNFVHLNGTFTINGLQGAGPLAGTSLDIGRGPVYVGYASVATDPIADVKAGLANGYNGGAWTGAPGPSKGVITSATATADPLHKTGIAYVDAADGTGLNAVPGTILLKYAVIGDVDLDGVVGLSDYTAVVRNFGVGTNWDQGAVTYGATVGLNDYTAVVRNFGQSTPAAAPAAAAAAGTTSSASITASTTSATSAGGVTASAVGTSTAATTSQADAAGSDATRAGLKRRRPWRHLGRP